MKSTATALLSLMYSTWYRNSR